MPERTPYRPWSRWNRVRQQILERDQRTCQIQTHCDGTSGKANAVDHIVSWRTGGAWFDPDNLRAACTRCNSARATSQHLGWQQADTEIVAVMRSAWPTITPDPDDLILDVEQLTAAVAPTSAVNAAHRQAGSNAWHRLVAQLTRGNLDAGRVWVIADTVEAADMLPRHSLIEGDNNGEQTEGQRHSVETGRW